MSPAALIDPAQNSSKPTGMGRKVSEPSDSTRTGPKKVSAEICPASLISPESEFPSSGKSSTVPSSSVKRSARVGMRKFPGSNAVAIRSPLLLIDVPRLPASPESSPTIV